MLFLEYFAWFLSIRQKRRWQAKTWELACFFVSNLDLLLMILFASNRRNNIMLPFLSWAQALLFHNMSSIAMSNYYYLFITILNLIVWVCMVLGWILCGIFICKLVLMEITICLKVQMCQGHLLICPKNMFFCSMLYGHKFFA